MSRVYVLLLLILFTASLINSQTQIAGGSFSGGGGILQGTNTRAYSIVSQPIIGTAESDNYRMGAGVWFQNVNIVTGIQKIDNELLPTKFDLYQNYPNPFNPSTKIKFAVPKKAFVRLTIFNILGQEVTRLIENELIPGYYEFNFSAAGLSSGVYVYRIQTKDYIKSRKMLLLK